MNNKLILASADWCGPCQLLKQRLEKADLLHLVEIKDADIDGDFFKQHDIKSVPRLIIYSLDGKLENSISGIEEIYKTISQ
jgi:hypothetical protein